MTVTLLAAADARWGIGLEGGLPWRLPEDLARFRRRTMGRMVIAGRKTAEGLPGGLPGRRLVTVSRAAGFPSVEEAVAAARGEGAGESFVIGGAETYLAALPLADRAEVTRVPGEWRCDAFMPDLAAHGWKLSRTFREGALEIEEWKP